MQWNNHLKDVPEGSHAFLGASKYSWLNYDEEKLKKVYANHLAIERGTKLHALARDCIKLQQKLPAKKKTFNMFVNDAIKFGMRPEQSLKYSEFCFGTADAISFDDYFLRIHDLKTGETKSSLHQLEIYAALFCLEYDYIPSDLKGIELRIYQYDDVLIDNPDFERIVPVMDKIVSFDKILRILKEEESHA